MWLLQALAELTPSIILRGRGGEGAVGGWGGLIKAAKVWLHSKQANLPKQVPRFQNHHRSATEFEEIRNIFFLHILFILQHLQGTVVEMIHNFFFFKICLFSDFSIYSPFVLSRECGLLWFESLCGKLFRESVDLPLIPSHIHPRPFIPILFFGWAYLFNLNSIFWNHS